jgi:hypothetical protein
MNFDAMNTKFGYLSVLLIGFAVIKVNAQTASEIGEQQKSLSLWVIEIEKTKQMPQGQAIELLGRCVVKMTKTSIFQIDDRWDVYRNAQAALLAIPGHAEYYRDKVLEVRKIRDQAVGNIQYSGKAGDYRNALHEAMETLKQLPSPETIRVLGDFLSDQSANPFSPQDGMKESPTSHVAVGALCCLPLVSKPADTKYAYQAKDDLLAWQAWYEQIKAGTRTFRFEGDPQEYDLNGPASKEKLQRIALSHKRDEERAAGRRPSPSDPDSAAVQKFGSSGFPVASVAAACGIVIAALWYLFRAGRRRA